MQKNMPLLGYVVSAGQAETLGGVSASAYNSAALGGC